MQTTPEPVWFVDVYHVGGSAPETIGPVDYSTAVVYHNFFLPIDGVGEIRVRRCLRAAYRRPVAAMLAAEPPRFVHPRPRPPQVQLDVMDLRFLLPVRTGRPPEAKASASLRAKIVGQLPLR